MRHLALLEEIKRFEGLGALRRTIAPTRRRPGAPFLFYLFKIRLTSVLQRTRWKSDFQRVRCRTDGFYPLWRRTKSNGFDRLISLNCEPGHFIVSVGVRIERIESPS